jgi:hypothetical protein
MKNKIILGCLLGTFLFVSCKKEEEAKVTEEVQQPAETFSGEAWMKQQVGGNQVQVQPVQQQGQPVQQPQQIQPQATAQGINPPHGQPNHRCDIAVGAPLNSTPNAKAQAAPPTVSQPIQAAPVKVEPPKPAIVNTVQTATAPGMNPPHGQEGHRCEIAVGAPLPKT